MTAIFIELDKDHQHTTLMKIAPYADMNAILTQYAPLYKVHRAHGLNVKPLVLDLDSLGYSDAEQQIITTYLIDRTLNAVTHSMALALEKHNWLAVKQALNKMIQIESTVV